MISFAQDRLVPQEVVVHHQTVAEVVVVESHAENRSFRINVNFSVTQNFWSPTKLFRSIRVWLFKSPDKDVKLV